MKPNLRLQILLAITGFLLVFAFLLFEEQPPIEETAVPAQTIIVSEDGNCSALLPMPGGHFVEGFVGAPRFLNPLLNDQFPVDRTISSLLFDGLVRYDFAKQEFAPALAESWEVSEDGRLITFTLFLDKTWHDGQPVTANDVAFTYGLMQDSDFPGSPALINLWQTVTIQVLDSQTIQFELTESYAPFLEATARGILPQHLLQGVTAVQLADHPFNLEPIGTGPFRVANSEAWLETGQLRLVPYPEPETAVFLDSLTFQFFPDFATLRDAYQSGQVNGIGSVPHTQFLETVRQVNGRLISNPIPRYTTLLFNFDESGNAQLKTRDMRLALAQGLDRQQIIDDSLAGQAIIFDGPYLPTSSAFAPEIATPIATNVVSATTVLNNLGWVLLDGASVRQNSDERLVLRLVGLEADRAVVTAVADQWTGLGIEIAIALEPNIEALRATLGNGEFDVALVDIAPSYDPDLYDFWSQEAIVRGQNYGKWNNRRASEALENGRQVWNREQRHAYYDTFIRIYDVELPALTLYQQINTVLISEDIQAVNLGIIQTPRDHYRNFPQWFVNVEEQDVPCN